MSFLRFLLVGASIGLSSGLLAMDTATLDDRTKLDRFDSYSILCINTATQKSFMFHPDVHGNAVYDISEVTVTPFTLSSPNGWKTTGFTCVGDTSFFLRFEYGKWRLGVLAKENFWGYPLPSIQVFRNIYVVTIPRIMQVSGKPSDPSLSHREWLLEELVANSERAEKDSVNPLYSDEFIAQYEHLNPDYKEAHNSVEFSTTLLPVSPSVCLYTAWSAFGAFAYYCNPEFSGEIKSMLSCEPLSEFVNQVKYAITPRVRSYFGLAPVSTTGAVSFGAAGSAFSPIPRRLPSSPEAAGLTEGEISTPTSVSEVPLILDDVEPSPSKKACKDLSVGDPEA